MNNGGAQSVGDTASAGLIRLGALVAARMGLHFPESRQGDLLRGAQALAREHGREDTEAFLQSLLAAPLTDRQMEILTAHLTVGETYFFREMKSLDAFRDHVIPELIRQRAGGDQRLRIWSAGCSTGEEAYTIAMILSELIPDLDAWDVDILATDINPLSLDKARQGVYTEWSFRGMPESLRKRYFEPQGKKTFAVRPRFRGMVSFACLNLATDVYPSLQNNTNAMDVIFCRNVLMYFLPELVQKVIMHFRNCLVEGGWFIVAPSESSMLLASEFASVPLDGATIYRKDSHKPAAATVWQMPPIAAKPVEEEWKFFPPLSTPVPSVQSGKDKTSAAPTGTPQSAFRNPETDPYEEALVAYRAGCYADAEATLQTLLGADGATERGIKAGNSFALMARIDANQGKLNQAVEWAEKAITADKVNPGFYYLLSTILEEQHRPKDAVQALKRALYLDSTFILAHFALGNIALQENGRKNADRHFVNAAALLARLPKDEVLPESEGVTAGRLLEIIESITESANSNQETRQ